IVESIDSGSSGSILTIAAFRRTVRGRSTTQKIKKRVTTPPTQRAGFLITVVVPRMALEYLAFAGKKQAKLATAARRWCGATSGPDLQACGRAMGRPRAGTDARHILNDATPNRTS